MGFDIANVTLDEAVAEVLELIRSKAFAHVTFLNAHYVNVAASDPEYRDALRAADRMYADGAGMRIAGRLAGARLRDNVNGTDLFPKLSAAMAGEGMRIFLFGASPGVAEDVAGWLESNFPGLGVCGARDGFGHLKDGERLVEEIRRASPDLLLVAMGAPAQDVWIRRHLDRVKVPVVMAVGGLFDFYSFRVRRAPRWVRKLGLEWLFRLAQEPRRLWRRYLLGNVQFLIRAAALGVTGRQAEVSR